MSTTTETKLAVQISKNNIPFDLTTWSPITSHGVLCFHRSQFCDFSLVHFFGFLDPESNGAAEILHQNFSLFDFRGVHFTSYHWTEGHLAPQLLSNGQGQGSLQRIYYVQHNSDFNTIRIQSKFNIPDSKSRKQYFKNKQFNISIVHAFQISMFETSKFNSICCIIGTKEMTTGQKILNPA